MMQLSQPDHARREGESILLKWQDGHTSRMVLDWLRDNCTCSTCRHANGQKLFNIHELPETLGVMEVNCDGQGLHISWSDGHRSFYSTRWLQEHDLNPGARAERVKRRQSRHTWNASNGQNYPRCAWSALNQDQDAEQRWLTGFHQWGFGVLTQVPLTSGAVATVGERLGHVRVTNYGRLFDVRSVPDPNNLADTALGLSVHSDNPYRHPSPGVQLLHCLMADAPGGDTLLVDGFSCAEQLRNTDAEAFALLSTWPMLFRYRSASVDLKARQTLITVDAEGSITAVHFNNRSSFFLDIPEDLAAKWYRAYRTFAHLLNLESNTLVLHLHPGDCIVMQNDRTLHGRTAFDPNRGARLLQGCYIDIDAMRSRSAVLDTLL
jgi:gamma-butyrobetaine dioxygenase